MSGPPRERIGTRVRPRDYAWLLGIGIVFAISGLALCTAGWWALLGVPLAGLGGLTLWVAGTRALRPDGVLVDDYGDTLIVRNVLGRSRPVEWSSVVGFRATAAEGSMQVRDGSSIFLFSSRRQVARGEEIHHLVERLNAMLRRRRGGRDGPPVDLRIGPVVRRDGAFEEMGWGARGDIFVGTSMLLAILVALALDPSGLLSAWNLVGGLVVLGFGSFYVWHGWQVMKQPDGVRVRENDDLIVVLDGWGHTRRIAWPAIAGFRATDDAGGVLDLRDGSRLWLFAPIEDGPGLAQRRDEIAEMIARLNAILGQRQNS